MYKRTLIRRMPPSRRGMMGLGAFDDTTQCSSIPPGDPYRKPGNYCATPDGGNTTFNADGTTYWMPGAVNPDPANLRTPTTTTSGGSAGGGGGFLSTLLQTFTTPALSPTVPVAPPGPGGLSTTTMLMLAGGAVVVALLLARR